MVSDSARYPEDRSPGEHAFLLSAAAANALPVLGGPLAEVVQAYWTPRLERRRAEWFNQLSDDIEFVAQEVTELQDKLDDEAVLDAALQATAIADRSRSDEKRAMLRATILNTALGVEPEDEIRDIFLYLVERLTPAHLRMLAFLDDPAGFAKRMGSSLDENMMAGSLGRHVERVFPDWDREFYDRLVADLDSEGLSQGSGALHSTMTARGTFERRTTGLGQRFIRFVTHPREDVS